MHDLVTSKISNQQSAIINPFAALERSERVGLHKNKHNYAHRAGARHNGIFPHLGDIALYLTMDPSL